MKISLTDDFDVAVAFLNTRRQRDGDRRFDRRARGRSGEGDLRRSKMVRGTLQVLLVGAKGLNDADLFGMFSCFPSATFDPFRLTKGGLAHRLISGFLDFLLFWSAKSGFFSPLFFNAKKGNVISWSTIDVKICVRLWPLGSKLHDLFDGSEFRILNHVRLRTKSSGYFAVFLLLQIPFAYEWNILYDLLSLLFKGILFLKGTCHYWENNQVVAFAGSAAYGNCKVFSF